MSYIGTTKIGKIFLGATEIGKIYLGTNLVFQKGGNLPYTPVDYIETDGVAYINTGINGNDPRSCEIKYMTSNGQYFHCPLGVGDGNENTNLYCPLYISGSGYPGFGHRYFYSNSSAQITANSPFIAKCAMKVSSQSFAVKRAGDADFITLSKTQSGNLQTGKTMFLFAAHKPSTDGPYNNSPSGSRLYYCKIYSTNTYTNLVFDGIPCVYNGEYGLWDRVSDTFFGNAAGSGAFTGPQIS